MKTANLPTNVTDSLGNLHLLEDMDHFISIIGSRDASSKTLDLTKRVAKFLVEQNFIIVSGLAKGIDTAAHKAALEAKGKTVSVLGTPLKKIYPSENKDLAEEIVNNDGLLLTTAKPDETFGKYLFPRRNKVMAKISRATIVIEAGEKSGVISQCHECIKDGRILIFSKHLADQKYEWVQSFVKDQKVQIFETKEDLVDMLKKDQ